MIKIQLGEKKFYVPFVSGRTLREIGPMDDLYRRAQENENMTEKDMDIAARWFCVLFQNQFNVDDLYDNYPADMFWTDVFTAYLAAKGSATSVLTEFPTNPEAMAKMREAQTEA